AAHDEAVRDAVAPQVVHRRLADLVFGQLGDEVALQSVVRERDGDVGLAAAEDDVEALRLRKPLEARRREPEHDFAEGDDFHGWVNAWACRKKWMVWLRQNVSSFHPESRLAG